MKTQMTIAAAAAGMLFSLHSLAAPVNINTADAATLAESLNGVGAVISEEIVSYREEHGGFEAPEDLMEVNGIGPATFEDNAEDILVEGQAGDETEE